MVPAYAEKVKEIVATQHKAGRPAVLYFIHSVLQGYLVPELGVLAEEWQTPYGSYGSKALCYRSSFVDYMIHNWSKWAEEFGIDG